MSGNSIFGVQPSLQRRKSSFMSFEKIIWFRHVTSLSASLIHAWLHFRSHLKTMIVVACVIGNPQRFRVEIGVAHERRQAWSELQQIPGCRFFYFFSLHTEHLTRLAFYWQRQSGCENEATASAFFRETGRGILHENLYLPMHKSSIKKEIREIFRHVNFNFFQNLSEVNLLAERAGFGGDRPARCMLGAKNSTTYRNTTFEIAHLKF